MGVFSLDGWSRLLPTRFLVSRRTQDTTGLHSDFMYGACTLCGRPFDAVPLSSLLSYRGPTTPALMLVWAPPLSLAATQGITFVFFSSGYLDVSVPRVALIGLCIHPHDDTLLRVPDFSIRISADLCFLTAPRSVSPFDASFFSSMCLGIHRMPLLT